MSVVLKILVLSGIALASSACSGDLPTGTVISVDGDACPSGWDEFKEARGRFIVGVNPSVPSAPPGSKAENGLSVRERGTPGGAEQHELTLEEMPKHTHMTQGYAGTDGDRTSRGDSLFQANNHESGPAGGDADGKTVPFEITPPYIALLQCRKA